MKPRNIALWLTVATLAGCPRPGGRAVDPAPVEAPQVEPPSAQSTPVPEIPEVPEHVLDENLATGLVELSTTCVDREYPNKPSNVVINDESARVPRELHPAFHGCFDWHSAVHGHWAMVRILRTFPQIEAGPAIRATIDRHVNVKTIAGEVAYFEAEHNRLFERPYGWGWLLRLDAELRAFDDPDATRWAEALAPLSAIVQERIAEYLPVLSVPVRAGTHHNTAYALSHIHDHAVATGNTSLAELIEKRSRAYYLDDQQCPTSYEPSGEDFISPCLAEADLMRRVLAQDRFVEWLDGFLPPVGSDGFAPLREPAEILDPDDPKIGHLIGLFFQRAASYRGIASALPRDDARRAVFEKLAAVHTHAALGQMVDSGYAGEHWLASFAIYLLTDSGPYPAVSG